MSAYPKYETISKVTEDGMEFFFVSVGEIDIIKSVQYIHAFNYKGRSVYNLAFGEYDLRTNTLRDDIISNNGDTYFVFRTVLATIPDFFSIYPNAMIMAGGSDSIEGYQENCRRSCKKSCGPNVCKNVHRRITLYQNYVNKNFEELSKEYKFFGGFITNESQPIIKSYRKIHPYPLIFLKKLGKDFS